MKLNIKQSANLFFVVVLALCVVNILVFVVSHKTAKSNESWVTHTNEVILLSSDLMGSMKDAETGQRGYLLTNNENYLTPYFHGIENSRLKLKALIDKTADNPQQQRRLKHLRELIETKFSELQDTVDLQLDGRSQLALDIVNTNLGKQVMDEIRTEIAAFVKVEKSLLEHRLEQYERSSRLSLSLTVANLIVIYIIIAITAFFVRKKVVVPITTLTKSTRNYTQGGRFSFEQVKVNNELGQLSNAFAVMSAEIDKAFNELTKEKEISDSANEAKSQFLANMSHEIRTPLNGIYGSLQLMHQRDMVLEERERLIENSMLSCKSLLTIINDILDFSKIEARQLSLEQLPLDFTKIAHHVISDLSPLAATKNIIIEVTQRKDYNEGWVGDPVRIKQILLNLLSNAVKFTEQGSIELSFGQMSSQGKTWLSFDVTDSGVGMSESVLDRLFERFEQADKSTTRKFGGTGLGMAITKALVELMEGKLEVHSEVGVGSCFSVYLPLRQTDLSQQHNINKVQLVAPDLDGVDVLLAEDNKVNQTIFKAMMKSTGASVSVAENGQEAIELMSKVEADIVFMDIQMPILDGIAANQIIRSRYPKVPVIALTANVMEHDVQLYKSEGFVTYIGKPLEMATLYSSLERYLSK